MSKETRLLYGKGEIAVRVSESAVILEGMSISALADPENSVIEALNQPIGSPSLAELIQAKKPQNVAITISDITRPVPNKVFLPPILAQLNRSGIADEQIVIIIGTGMHRPSTNEEKDILVGQEILSRFEVIDHKADDPSTLVRLSSNPPVSLCRRFAEADFKIVTGLIEPHFMAGFSGGRKGVCPALVDLKTIQRFHGFETLADSGAENGILENNPCHEISLNVAEMAGVDFLFNVALTKDRKIAGIYCGHLEKAHLEGCKKVSMWATARFERPFDLVITSGGGYPLDLTFYQTVKGMCTALPALHKGSTLLQVSKCDEQLGSPAYTELMLKYNNDWQRFLKDIETNKEQTLLDQWEFQMQTRVLKLIGRERLWFISDGIPEHIRNRICVTPIPGAGDAGKRTQQAVDNYLELNNKARVAVIPDGPYTMLQNE